MESIVCKNCLPEEYHHKAHKMRGYWEIDEERGIAKCANCGFERKFTRRKSSSKITPAQQKAIDRIEHYFKDYHEMYEGGYRYPKLHTFEIEKTDYGIIFVKVDTTDNYFTNKGGFFSVGPRGAIKVHSAYNGTIERKTVEKWYAKALHAKIGW